MPELPEVETVRRALARVLPGHAIRAVRCQRRDLRLPFPAALKGVAGRKITTLARRAKYLLAHLDDGRTLILHLGMSGRLTLAKNHRLEKHDHMLVTFANGRQLVFNDPRRFGLVALEKTADLERHKFFAHLGPEPFDKAFSAAYLGAKFKAKKVAVKLAIMDQKLVVGVGNIYAAEALFVAGIDPRRAARTLTPAQCAALVAAIRQVLKKAIRAGGSTWRDYVRPDGEAGAFRWAVYDKEGQKCPGCRCDVRKTGGIRRLIQGGRSTFYCPFKQG